MHDLSKYSDVCGTIYYVAMRHTVVSIPICVAYDELLIECMLRSRARGTSTRDTSIHLLFRVSQNRLRNFKAEELLEEQRRLDPSN